jgi:hypothetical protein
MKEVKDAIRAALKNPALLKRAAKDAAESYVRGAAYREMDKLRQADEEADEPAEESAAPVRSAAPAAAAVRHVSPAAMADAARKR